MLVRDIIQWLSKILLQSRLWGTLEALDMMTRCTGKLGYVVQLYIIIALSGNVAHFYINHIQPRFMGLATDPAYAAYYHGYSNGLATEVD